MQLTRLLDATTDRPSATKTALDAKNAEPLDALLLYREIKRAAPVACWRAGGGKKGPCDKAACVKTLRTRRDKVAPR